MRVMIVVDDERLLRTMQNQLVCAGHDVIGFATFEPAKRYLSIYRPDVLVTDVRLGAFNGLQLALMAKLDRPESAALVLSRHEDQVLRQDAARIGAHFHIKPIASEHLLTEIEVAHRLSAHG